MNHDATRATAKSAATAHGKADAPRSTEGGARASGECRLETDARFADVAQTALGVALKASLQQAA